MKRSGSTALTVRGTALARTDLVALRRAKDLLEHPGLAITLASLVGAPVEFALKKLPGKIAARIESATHAALRAALKTALATLGKPSRAPRSADLAHKLASAASGAAGGFFGVSAIALELPLSTTIMLRSIADIARSEGEDLAAPEGALACLEVFALGGRTASDNEADSAYFLIRAELARELSRAAEFLLQKGFAQKGAPVLVRLLSRIAARFTVPVSQKVAAQALPIIGAAGGALLNTVFIAHFQGMARGHFVVRRLERKYGADLVRLAYLEA